MGDDATSGRVSPDGPGGAAVEREIDGPDPEIMSPAAAVLLNIVTTGLHSVWAFLPRLARHERVTGVAPLAEEARGDRPREAGPVAHEPLAPWLFTIAWILLATAMAFGSAAVFSFGSRRGGRGSALPVWSLATGLLGALAFPAVVQVYARWLLGRIERRETAALGRVAGRLGEPPDVRVFRSGSGTGRWVLVALIPILLPSVTAFGLFGPSFRLLVIAAIAFTILSVWGLTVGPAVTAVLTNRHVRACRRAQAWLGERLAEQEAAAPAAGGAGKRG